MDRALDIVLTAQRIDARAGSAKVSGDEREIDQRFVAGQRRPFAAGLYKRPFLAVTCMVEGKA